MQIGSQAPLVRVRVFFDPEVQGYWANSPDLDGFVVTGATRNELEKEARLAAGTLLELAGVDGEPEIRFEEASG